MKLDFGLVQLIISRVSSLVTGAGLDLLDGVFPFHKKIVNLLLFLCTLYCIDIYGSVKDII